MESFYNFWLHYHEVDNLKYYDIIIEFIIIFYFQTIDERCINWIAYDPLTKNVKIIVSKSSNFRSQRVFVDRLYVYIIIYRFYFLDLYDLIDQILIYLLGILLLLDFLYPRKSSS